MSGVSADMVSASSMSSELAFGGGSSCRLGGAVSLAPACAGGAVSSRVSGSLAGASVVSVVSAAAEGARLSSSWLATASSSSIGPPMAV